MNKTLLTSLLALLAFVGVACGGEDATRDDFIAFVAEQEMGLDETQTECLADKLEEDGRFSWTFLLEADENAAEADDAIAALGTFTIECISPVASDEELPAPEDATPAVELSDRETFIAFWTSDGTSVEGADCLADFIDSRPDISFSLVLGENPESGEEMAAEFNAVWEKAGACAIEHGDIPLD